MKHIEKYIVAISVLLIILGLLINTNTVGYITTLLIIGLVLYKPKSGLFLLLVYFPTRPFLLEINDGLKYLGDLVIIVLTGYVLVKNIRNKGFLTKNIVFAIGFLVFCIIGAVSAMLTGVSLMAIIFQLRAFLITFLLIFVVKGLNISKSDILTFLWITLIVTITLCIQGIIEKVSLRTMLLPTAWSEMYLPETNRIRIYSLIGNPNVFATYLSISFFISIYLRQYYQKHRIALTAISVLIFGVFLLTYSRGTLIAFVIGLVAYVLLSRKWKVIVPLGLSILLSFPLIYFPVNALTNQMENQANENHQSEEVTNGENENLATDPSHHNKGDLTKRLTEAVDKNTIKQSLEWGRLYVVIKGFEVFRDHPIIGTGFATFGDSASLLYSSPIYEDYGLPAEIYSDNQYIQVIVQTGSLGVVSFAIFIIGMVVIMWKKRNDSPIALPLLAFLVGGSVAGIFYNIWEDKTFTLYYFIILGYLLNERISKREKAEIDNA